MTYVHTGGAQYSGSTIHKAGIFLCEAQNNGDAAMGQHVGSPKLNKKNKREIDIKSISLKISY